MNAALNAVQLEPVVAIPQYVCGTCRMAMIHDRVVRSDGTLLLRYPCDSCKESIVTVQCPVAFKP